MVAIPPLDQHVHRFIWRDYKTEREPDVYVKTIFIDMIAPKGPRAMRKLTRFFSRDHRNTHGIGQSIYSISTLVIALFCVHAPSGRYRTPFFVVVFHVSVAERFLMAEVPVPILRDVFVAGLPAADDNLVSLVEEVGWVISLYSVFVLRFVVQF